MAKEYKFVFGPVPSRRLGSSLGVDLLPFKTCSYDCVYCQVGPTTDQTVERVEFVGVSEVVAELRRKLREKLKIDYLTFSGSGEPTLHSGLGKIISRVKKFSRFPVAVITNGSLLGMPEVQEDLQLADVILPTLSSADPMTFAKIHRPYPGITLDKVIAGMIDFRKNYRGQIWLEVFIVKGINDTPRQMHLLRPVIRKIEPDRIQVNTSIRLPNEKYSRALEITALGNLAYILGRRAEVIAEKTRLVRPAHERTTNEKEILGFLKRRPATPEELASGLKVCVEHAKELLRKMTHEGTISKRRWEEREVFYFRK